MHESLQDSSKPTKAPFFNRNDVMIAKESLIASFCSGLGLAIATGLVALMVGAMSGGKKPSGSNQ